MPRKLPVSLIVPLYNESASIDRLINSLKNQSAQPEEIILVDGGSSDNTVEILKGILGGDDQFRIVEAGRAMPGKARNIGIELAKNGWIALTDAGIRLDPQWLEILWKKTELNPETAIVFGNFSPELHTFFDRCAMISYVAPLRPQSIRTKFIASCLLRKEVWEKVKGFPDWRATEDLVFIEKAEQLGFKSAIAPDAMVYWELRRGLGSTFRRFEMYSKYNVWAGRQAFWHYGVARQYAFVLAVILMTIFHRWYWILLVPVWMLARVAKRIFAHRHEFGLGTLLNPLVWVMVMIITLSIDAATFSGWIQAIFNKKIS